MAKSKASEPVAPDREVGRRISIQLTDDGSAVAWDRVRASTKDELRKLGLLADSPKPVEPAFQIPDAWCSMMLDALAHLEIAFAMKVYSATIDEARLLLYSDEEKRSIVPTLKKVLEKYSGTLFVRFGDELMLTMMLVATGAPKLARVRDAALERVTPRLVPFPQPQPPPDSQA